MVNMKKLITTALTIVVFTTLCLGQCTSLFSFAAYFNQVTFVNQSTVSNAHYFWNFGDGTGSNLANPIHTFPGTGDYLVTLFAKDTISNCSSYYEYWVDVTKYSTEACQPTISDSIFNDGGQDYMNIFNTSANCNGYNIIYSAGPNCNYLPIRLWTTAFRMVCEAQYYDNSWNFIGQAFKTAYHNYSSSHNYGDCSANFEFIVVSKDSVNERILFTAMNKTAAEYQWYITGFGNPITSSYDTISQLFPLNSSACPWNVALIIQGLSGCHDTIWQNIEVGDSAQTIASVNDLKDATGRVDVYPNPSRGVFNIVVRDKEQGISELQVYNVLGEKICDEKLTSATAQINISNQPTGVYLYRVLNTEGGLLGEGKLIIQK